MGGDVAQPISTNTHTNTRARTRARTQCRAVMTRLYDKPIGRRQNTLQQGRGKPYDVGKRPTVRVCVHVHMCVCIVRFVKSQSPKFQTENP